MNRSEHLQWCKDRALEYVEKGEFANAIASMGSDLNKHPETAGHPAISLSIGLLALGDLSTIDQARKFIEGFN